MKLGKLPAKIDKRTIKLASIVKDVLPVMPKSFNVDKSFPLLKFPEGDAFGNIEHGDCVEVAKYMHLLRFEGYELGMILPITTEDILAQYFEETGGPEYDRGLVMLDSLNQWRQTGLRVGKTRKILCLSRVKRFKCHAFADLDMEHIDEVKASIFFLSGLSTGLMLPMTAQEQWEKGEIFDYVEGPGNAKGSWGGHGVYTYSYEAVNDKTDDYVFECYTWGKRQKMTYRFMKHYCDERYAVVDQKDMEGSPVDEEKLSRILTEVTR